MAQITPSGTPSGNPTGAPASQRGRNRIATLLAFVILVVVGRQVTPQSSSAAELDMAGEVRPDWIDEHQPPQVQQAGYYVIGSAAPYTVRRTDGVVVAEGLTSGQLMARFPDLRPWTNGADPFGLASGR